MSASKLNVGVFIFDNMTMLDGYAPLQFFAFVPQFNAFTFARSAAPVRADCGAVLTPSHDFAGCPPLDILVVPGGGNVLPEMLDPEVRAFLREQGARAQYVTSVCTGALILAEAGLLDGYRATTHWASLDYLRAYRAIEVVDERVVVDRNRITGGGVTAGIDFALTVIAKVADPLTAQTMQLLFEYRPEPPFDAGSPATAPAAAVANIQQLIGTLDADLRAHIAGKRAA
jgi:transcriptional regulator GlxA family with amidase domain